MKTNKNIAAVFAAVLMLSACSAVQNGDETDTIPVLEDNIPAGGGVIITSEAIEVIEEITEASTSETIASESSKPAETWANTDEEPLEIPQRTESETEESYPEGEITYIELTYYNVTLETGDSSMPIVTMYPEDAPDKSEIWSSSDESVAEVDDIGNITAISEGECIIKVQSAVTPEVFAEVYVTVISPEEEESEAETEAFSENESETQLTFIDGILIANKSYPLPADYNPGVNADAQAAFDRMQSAAAEEGLNIYISSGFRSYDYQAGLYERYVERSGKAEADRYSARPGYSEHQTGLAFDLNSIDITFADTDEYEWVKEHCAEYGFIIRYPEGKESVTGYMYEPWHIRYLGTDIAKSVSDSGLTLEEYLGIDSKYAE
ncbi:MAG: D-alanyl-D-alanine carboxypeptidase family protein [Oscillospiraceae bacterium]|nr:D-alanyl-D-alanine carboxypeptidase family protein [Oscillospiraceae bacterium]